MASVISMKALLESGVHFGHRTNKWHPLMKPYIFTERNGIHIIDLQQTVKAINTAYNVVRDSVSEGGVVMFVGTKRQAQETIQMEATRCGMPYVTERWLGGTLTNWVTIQQRIMELDRLERIRDTGDITRLTKKEGLLIEREITRLLTHLSGIRMLNKTPDLIFMIDVTREATALHEANLKDIPIIALVDTNCDPRGVEYVIPSNDDAIRAIKVLVGKIADAVLEGRALRKEGDFGEDEAMITSRISIPSRLTIDDDELQDEDLLGAATLAKLGGSKETKLPEEDEAATDILPEEEAVEPKLSKEDETTPNISPEEQAVEPELSEEDETTLDISPEEEAVEPELSEEDETPTDISPEEEAI